ncbi:DNA-directed RNA polymerase specialized sigma24 family protein [Streptomyces sp. TLI_171]|nr:DNA-directed RNA polymerase specialized sigma24 family protein [Streptomyces sp. TLI_171]
MRRTDGLSFEEYAAACSRRLYRTAYLLCGDGHRAEDLAQATLAKLFAHWRRVSRMENLDAYARTVLTRTFLAEQRRWSVARQLGVLAGSPEVSPGSDADLRVTLLTALAELPARARAMVVLRPLLLHYDGRAWSRVAAPDLDSRYGELTHLVAAGPGDIWAAGNENPDLSRHQQALVAHFDGRAWSHRDTGVELGTLNGLTRTPDGIAVVGVVVENGVYRPTGAQLRRGGWESLDLPQGPTIGGRYPRGIVSIAGRLTVVGLDSRGEAADGEPVPPLPFSLRR